MTTPPLDLTAERLTALRETAKAATEGPWGIYKDAAGGMRGAAVETEWAHDEQGEDTELITDWCLPADARHIAAFDPTTVLALLDRVEEADGLLARLSASGGRNIDLIARAEAAERDLAAVAVSRDGWQTRAEAAEKKVAQALADLNATIADAEPSNYEEDNYDAGYVHGLIEARDILTITALDTHTPETETTP